MTIGQEHSPVSSRVIAVIQARMGSSRLPGKVLRSLGNRPVLEWVIRAAREASTLDGIVVATSTSGSDDAIVALCARLGVPVVRGDEDDVLSRFLLAADATEADAIVRLTADCPLLDPHLIKQIVALWHADPALDYVSTTLHRSLPRGLDVELATTLALRRSAEIPTGHHRSHVTSALYESGSGFSCSGLVFQPAFDHYRVTLDEEADAQALDALVELIGDRAPSWRATVAMLDAHPEIAVLNASVLQKPLLQG